MHKVVKRHIRLAFSVALLAFSSAILSACLVQSRVQGRYIDAQENCRNIAEQNVAKMPNSASMTPDQQGAEVVNQFSICMNKSGWHVANPLKPKGDKPEEVVVQPVGAPGNPALRPAPQQTLRPAPPPAPTAAPTVGSPAAQPTDIAPPAHYERSVDSPSTTPSEQYNGRQF